MSFSLLATAEKNITVQDYVPERFALTLFQLYFKTLGELDALEIEFLDLPAIQSLDRQMFYGKEVLSKYLLFFALHQFLTHNVR